MLFWRMGQVSTLLDISETCTSYERHDITSIGAAKPETLMPLVTPP